MLTTSLRLHACARRIRRHIAATQLVVLAAGVSACSAQPAQDATATNASAANAAADSGIAPNTTSAAEPEGAGGTAGVPAASSEAGRMGNSAMSGAGAGDTTPTAGTAAPHAGAGPTAGTPTAGAGGNAGATAMPAGRSGSDAAGMPAGSPAAASGDKKFVGNITTRGQVRGDFSEYWDQITPENEGKWGSVERTRDQMDWSGLDRVHDYAKANGIVFKQHTFVWGSQQPGWLTGLSMQEQRAEVEEWIRLFCERYPDVALIDVVNEPPPHTAPAYMEALGGEGASGYDWIVQAFRWAREYCPNAILILNDYNNIEYGNDNAHFLDIVERVRSAGAPLDALGAQAHDAHKLPKDTLGGFIDKLAATGLPVYITEYDIDVADDAKQRLIMEEQFPLFWNDERIAGITLWGYVVGATWRPDTGLLSDGGMKRPALTWLEDYLGR